MVTHSDIKASLPDIIKSKDAVKLRTVRSVLTALTNEAVASGGTPQDLLDEASTTTVIKRLAKQRKDAMAQYKAAGRDDLLAIEQEELTVLEQYLPPMLSQADILSIAEAKKAALGVADKSKMGVLIGAVMKETAGRANGADVKAVIEGLFD